MKNIFPQYYQPTSDEFSKLLNECIFVFDANMVLNLYRYPSKARETLFKIFKKAAELERLWLPFHAALEFQKNRLSVIADQKSKFGKVKGVLTEIEKELKKKLLEDLKLRERHSSIDPDALIKDIHTAFQKYIEQFDTLESQQSDVWQEDGLRIEIDNIFNGKIGEAFSQKELDSIFSEGTIRYKNERPPGFKDEKEKKGYFIFHGDLTIKCEFGDLIVWKEIIKYINDKKPKGVVFVTDDNKEDWWLEINGKTIGPRPELLSELHAETQGACPFYMYKAAQFMEIVGPYLGIEVEQDSIKEAEIVSEELQAKHQPYRMNQRLRALLYNLYDGRCQICGFDKAAEIIHIMPWSIGEYGIGNVLLLCPNHHKLFDMGAFSISDELELIGIDGQLTVHHPHKISLKSLKYHRDNLYNPKNANQLSLNM